MARSSSSSAQQARQRLGDRLREIRIDAGLTATALAQRAGWHGKSKVSKIEHASRAPSADDIRTWCRVAGAEDQAADLVELARAVEGMWIEWRRMERAGLRYAQESVDPVFDRGRRFLAYSSWLIPGLIQTESYTRAILRAIARRRGLVDDVDAAVAVRMARKRVLRTPGKTFAFLLEESVLRAGIGGAAVMAGQLGHLADVSRLPNVSLGILPATADRDAAWPVEDFWVHDRDEVSVELVTGYLTITQAAEIDSYVGVFGALAGFAVYGARARAAIQSARAAFDQPGNLRQPR